MAFFAVCGSIVAEPLVKGPEFNGRHTIMYNVFLAIMIHLLLDICPWLCLGQISMESDYVCASQ